MAEKIGRRERKKLLSRKAILDAAVAEFSSKGYKETSVADIMNAADLGIGTFYNYFQSKEEILIELLGRMVHDVDEELAAMRAVRSPAREQLAAGCRITAKFLDENRYVLPLFLSAADHSGIPEGLKKMPSKVHTSGFKPVFTKILKEGVAAGWSSGSAATLASSDCSSSASAASASASSDCVSSSSCVPEIILST